MALPISGAQQIFGGLGGSDIMSLGASDFLSVFLAVYMVYKVISSVAPGLLLLDHFSLFSVAVPGCVLIHTIDILTM